MNKQQSVEAICEDVPISSRAMSYKLLSIQDQHDWMSEKEQMDGDQTDGKSAKKQKKIRIVL